MPMKAMIYKTLSTVIDDLFAYVAQPIENPPKIPLTCVCRSFCIKMPILHRLACFRDDVVFLVFLYQVSCTVCLRSPELTIDGFSAGSTELTPSE